MPSINSQNPIGIFDSGVGGLSVLRAIRQQMPEESVIYFGDQGHIPYGPRPLQQVRDFSEGITRFLLSKGAKIIVVACNAASAAALTYLRQTVHDISFVGMEPAVKPATEHTETGVVGVLATPATFQRRAIRVRSGTLCERRGIIARYLCWSRSTNRKGRFERNHEHAKFWKSTLPSDA